MNKEMKKIVETGQQAAYSAGKIISSLSTKLKVSEKASNDLVTQADIKAQKKIISRIETEFPQHMFYKEEAFHNDDLFSDNIWIIDPLDGTNNYVNGIPHYGISIAFAQKGIVKAGIVYDPCRDEMFWAATGSKSYCNGKLIKLSHAKNITETILATGFFYDRGKTMEKTLNTIKKLFKNNIRGIRRTGSAALDLCWVACGRFDAYFEYMLNPWDFAAGAFIIQSAGGICTGRTGTKLTLDSTGIIAANPHLFKKLKGRVLWRK